jgi:hypothetical protein
MLMMEDLYFFFDFKDDFAEYSNLGWQLILFQVLKCIIPCSSGL